MMSDLFSSGKIYLFRKPISGRYGIPKLTAYLTSGILGIDVSVGDTEEIYALFTTKRQDTLFILHIDEFGVDLTKRRLHGKKFVGILSDSTSLQNLTREQLKRLVLDGTHEGSWQSASLKEIMSNYFSARSMPATGST